MKSFLALAILIFFATGCEKQCFDTDKCKLKGEPGGCLAGFKGYYFSKKENKCVEFLWGGCGGVRPFATLDECVLSCECDK